MTPFEALKRLTDFTKEHIAPLLLMRKEPTTRNNDITKMPVDEFGNMPEYVHPTVTYGTMPHKNFVPYDFAVPLIMWTFDEVEDEGDASDKRTVAFRAYVAAYSSEIYEDEQSKLPDNKAFIDLINALEKIYQELSRRHIINGVGREKQISYGVYDGLFYPYAYGWVTFTAELPRMEYEDEIDLDTII